MRYYGENDVERILAQSVSSTETMNCLDVDPDIIKARLKILREIADGFGIDIRIPSNRAVMIGRFVSGMD